MIFAKILGNIISDINKKNADLDPFGGKYTPMEKYKMKKSGLAMLDKHISDKDKDGPSQPKGPTDAQKAASEAAAKAAARKLKGQARRKKYEAAQTMAKKMKLIFLD